MRVKTYVLLSVLCLLLCSGCGKEAEKPDPREAYREMTGCEMTVRVTCEESGREWSAALQCSYVPEGESTVEVVEPLLLAGVRAVIRETDWSLEYGDLCLDAGLLSVEDLSPAVTPVRMMNALREGWLLEENAENWNDVPCVRLALEQTGGTGTEIVTTLWLREADQTPLYGEISVEGQQILTAEFTDFKFCDILNHQAENTNEM